MAGRVARRTPWLSRSARDPFGGFGRAPVARVARLRGLGERQREVERGALARATLRPDPAAVLVDDLLADGEADAGALEAVRAVEAVEGAEDDVGLAGGEADAAVVHGDARHAVLHGRRDLHPRLTVLGELDRVGEQVLQQLG